MVEERIMSLIEGSFASLFTTDQEPRTKTQEPKKHQEVIINNQILQVGCIYFKLNTCIFFVPPIVGIVSWSLKAIFSYQTSAALLCLCLPFLFSGQTWSQINDPKWLS